jgi:23S rRNA (cytidine1920-2'-O)/16S rRNA (cytidine1409-2'-O)-methyltransferase
MKIKERLDLILVEKGLCKNRSKAQALIIAGEVVVNDHLVDKPGTLILKDSVIRIKNNLPYVSRGGLKLKAALDLWPSLIKEAICVDVGASTGGFTDVLLSAGAKQVFAIDVGHNQLDYSLRIDPRVVCLEKTHILKLEHKSLNPIPTIAVVDVSFISLIKVLPAILNQISEQAIIYALIKPQFEVGKEYIAKGGIVKDQIARQKALQAVLDAAQSLGLTIEGYSESPIKGTDGNVEYIAKFVRLHKTK